MKVLHVIGGNLDHGAAKGALFLHEALLTKGVHSKVFTNSCVGTDSEFVESLAASSYGKYKCKALRAADRFSTSFYRMQEQLVFSNNFLGFDIRKSQSYDSSDIIHLHWVNAGMMRLECLSKIEKPIVWTLRDMWPMTGGCHYSLDCEKYKSRCGNCVQLNSRREKDLSRINFTRKQKYFPKSMNIVGVSNWISRCAMQSTLLGSFNITTIHNGIDTSVFTPFDKASARNALGLPQDKKIVLVGAQGIDSPYKGFSYFEESIGKISADFYLAIFGRDVDTVMERLSIPTIQLGFLDSINKLRLVYAAADVFVAPSKVESFGKTIAEALSCGTPVVCFDATGQSDVVEHKVSGFKAIAFDTADLAKGIDWVIEDEARHKKLCEDARKNAVEKFDISVMAQKYLDVYESLLRCG